MADNIINNSKSCNYVSGNKVFILGEINEATTSELIGNLSNMVDELRFEPIYAIKNNTIKNPYVLPDPSIQVVDVYINSGGGLLSQAKSIMALLNLARAKGAIIRTTVMGYAGSSASLIAIQGTPNFRIMYEQSHNMVHYGNSKLLIDRGGDEMEKASQFEKTLRQTFNAPYMKYTNIKQNELSKLQKTEFGHMFARECLAKNMCDWILTTDGKFISRDQKQR